MKATTKVGRLGHWLIGSSSQSVHRENLEDERRKGEKKIEGWRGRFRYLSSVARGNWANVSEFQNSYRPEFSFNNQVIIHHIHLLPCFCRFGSFLVCSSNLFFHVYRNYHYSCRSLRIKFFFERKREVGLYEDREAYFANFFLKS